MNFHFLKTSKEQGRKRNCYESAAEPTHFMHSDKEFLPIPLVSDKE